jgi:NADH dehydrogenase
MIQGTKNLLLTAKEAGVRRWLHMSALGVNERSRSLVPYYGAKWAMEREVKASGLDWTIFRPSFIFGKDGGVLPMFIRQVRFLPVTPVAGDGARRLQPIWIEDVAAVYARALETPGSIGGTYDLGGPDTPTWDEFLRAIQKALGKKRRLVHIPLGLLQVNATVLELLPRPPVTRDQLRMLEFDDNVGDPRPAVETFGVQPLSLEEQLRRAIL